MIAWMTDESFLELMDSLCFLCVLHFFHFSLLLLFGFFFAKMKSQSHSFAHYLLLEGVGNGANDGSKHVLHNGRPKGDEKKINQRRRSTSNGVPCRAGDEGAGEGAQGGRGGGGGA